MSDWKDRNLEHFDATAAEYDRRKHAEDVTTKGAKAIIDEYKIVNPNHQEARTFEFGIGTGLVAIKLAPSVKSIVGVDISEEMLKQVQKKLDDPANASVAPKIKTVQHLVKDDDPFPTSCKSDVVSAGGEGFDLSYATMVMHHIEDVSATINMIVKHFVKKGSGWFYVVDIQYVEGISDKWHKIAQKGGDNHHHHDYGHASAREHQDEGEVGKGKKHAFEDIVPHNAGFKDEDLKRWLNDAGLVDVVVKTGFITEIYVPSEERKYPFQFVIAAGRRP